MFNKFPKRTGIYHIKDGIEHLELKVCFRHINSLLKLPKFDYNKNINTDWHSGEKPDDGNTHGELEFTEVCIKWQEKLFSSYEEEHYKESKNCISEIQKKYHDWLLENIETELAELDGAQSDEQQAISRRQRRRKKRSKKQQQKAMHELKQRKQAHEIHTYVDEDHFQAEEVTNNTADSIVHMYIYAALDVDTQLAHLQWYPKERMLHIYPDFNSFSHNPYFIEIDKDYRHLYAYALENISKTRTNLPGGDLSLYLELPELKPHWHTEEERAAIFAMPPKRTRRISLLLELREAHNFAHDNIHVRYHIHLPKNTIHEEGLLKASTHSSSMSDSGIHHFGYNWQLTLLCEEEYDAADLLHIYFEVISIDSWERERMEGYSFFTVNLLSASNPELHSLQCQLPVDSFWAAVESYFIAGRRKFDYVRFFGQELASADNADFHCRYGCRMKSTGILELLCQSFTQRNCELLKPCTNRKSGMTLDDIMLAYREARKRLEAVTLK